MEPLIVWHPYTPLASDCGKRPLPNPKLYKRRESTFLDNPRDVAIDKK
jgi:hypothetical protein